MSIQEQNQQIMSYNNVWSFLITLQHRKSLIFIVNIKLTRREKRNKQKIWNYFSSIHSWSYTLKDHLQWIVAYLNCFFFFWRTRVHEKRSQCANIENASVKKVRWNIWNYSSTILICQRYLTSRIAHRDKG